MYEIIQECRYQLFRYKIFHNFFIILGVILNLMEILLIGLVLSADSFSAALALGARKHDLKDSLKFAFYSGSAEAIAAFIGALSGKIINQYLDRYDHWIAFFLLVLVGINLFKEGLEELKGKSELEEVERNFHGNFKLLIVATATSLDALAVGVGIGSSGKIVYPYILSIGFWAFATTILGMYLGKKLSNRIGPYFHFIAALILILLGLKFLFNSN